MQFFMLCKKLLFECKARVKDSGKYRAGLTQWMHIDTLELQDFRIAVYANYI